MTDSYIALDLETTGLEPKKSKSNKTNINNTNFNNIYLILSERKNSILDRI